MGGVVAAIAGGVVAGGLRQLASGQRPDLPNLLLTPSNALRLTSGLSHLRGAALKLGQMLSMDTGLVLSPQISQIFASLRDDAKPMPPKQLQTVLNAQWGPGWLKQFRRFDVRPFAAALVAAAVSSVLGFTSVTISLCLAALISIARSRARSSVSASFSGEGMRKATASE
jgi:hypothetical protein